MSRHRRTGPKASRRPAVAITLPVPHPAAPRPITPKRVPAQPSPDRPGVACPERDSLPAAIHADGATLCRSEHRSMQRAGAAVCVLCFRAGRCRSEQEHHSGARLQSGLPDAPVRRPIEILMIAVGALFPGVRSGLAAARFHGRLSQHLAGRRGAGQCRRADPSRTAVMDNPRVGPGRTPRRRADRTDPGQAACAVDLTRSSGRSGSLPAGGLRDPRERRSSDRRTA
jgi:hypothetical protein